MLFLGCAILGTLSSILVVIGLRKDQREFLVPWILIMLLDIFVAILHFFSVVIFGNLKFEPLTGTLFTIDFFILCLNVSKQSKQHQNFANNYELNLTDLLSGMRRVTVPRVQSRSRFNTEPLHCCESRLRILRTRTRVINLCF